MKGKFFSSITASLVFTSILKADTLELKNGQVMEGNYQGGTAQTLRFQSGNETKVIQTSDIVALTFTGGKPSSGSASPAARESIAGEAAAAGASQPAGTISVPAGTPLKVRMVDGVNSSTDAAGKRFTGTLEANLSVNGAVLAPAGTTVHGQLAQAEQAGRLAGQSVLSLVLTDIVIHGESKPLSTSPVTLSGQAEGRQTARRAAGGAIVGGLAGDAGKGAAIGAGTAGIKKGEAVNVQPGTLMEFNLLQPLTLQTR